MFAANIWTMDATLRGKNNCFWTRNKA